MQDMSAMSLIRSLEILQGICVRLTTLIVDESMSHQILKRFPNTRIADLLMENKPPLLAKAGISVTLAPGKHHEAVGRSELVIKKIKRLMVSVLRLFNFANVWDFFHQISLVSPYSGLISKLSHPTH